MSFSKELNDMRDHKDFLAEEEAKVAVLEKAIDALIEVAEAGLGNHVTSDAINELNRIRARVHREYEENA